MPLRVRNHHASSIEPPLSLLAERIRLYDATDENAITFVKHVNVTTYLPGEYLKLQIHSTLSGDKDCQGIRCFVVSPENPSNLLIGSKIHDLYGMHPSGSMSAWSQRSPAPPCPALDEL